jgi:hypothetical protein
LLEEAVAAVVTILSVVLPPPLRVTGLKEHVVSEFEGGVQPKLMVPLKLPKIPTNATVCPDCPGVSVRVCGSKVRVKSLTVRGRVDDVAVEKLESPL